jgi:ribose transport system substrate-binding protein
MSISRTFRTVAGVAILASAVVLAGCAETPADGGSDGGDLRIGLVLGLNTNASYQSMFCGAQAAAEELGGIDVTFNSVPGFAASEEAPVLNAFALTDPDGVIVVPSEPDGMQKPIEDVVDKGILVVTADIAPKEPVGLSAIGPDNTKGGALAAEFLAEKMNHKGTVYVNSYIAGTNVDIERVGGFVDYMAANEPDIIVLPTEYSKADSTIAAQQTAAALRAHPEINGLYGQNELTAIGMATAVREAGLAGKIPFVAYDADEVQVKALKDGTFDALVSQGFYYTGYEGVKTLASVLRGEKDAADIPAKTESAIRLLTADNIDDDDSQPFIYRACS